MMVVDLCTYTKMQRFGFALQELNLSDSIMSITFVCTTSMSGQIFLPVVFELTFFYIVLGFFEHNKILELLLCNVQPSLASTFPIMPTW